MKAADYHIIKFIFCDSKTPYDTKGYMTSMKFFYNFFEKFTSKNLDEWWEIYNSDSVECVFEELNELYGILYYREDYAYRIYIPRIQSDIYQWFIDNIPFPYKLLKKTSFGAFTHKTYPTRKSRDFYGKMTANLTAKLGYKLTNNIKEWN